MSPVEATATGSANRLMVSLIIPGIGIRLPLT
jgi:hypothetical protein